MGYYVNLREADMVMPKANLDEALRRLKALNHDPNAKKGGGAWSPTGKTQVWFAWMDADYDQKVSSAREVFELLGFEVEDFEGGFILTGYDSKMGDEEQFLNAVKDLWEGDAYIVWEGEDGEFWKWTPRGVFEGKVVFPE